MSIDGLSRPSRPGDGPFSVASAMGADLEYGDYALSHDDFDSFYLAVDANPVFFRIGERLALGCYFASILMCGPVPEEDTPANIAAFWMNSVQFEYGLRETVAPFSGGRQGLHLTLEYARTSQHPLRPLFSEVASDILRLGLTPPVFARGRVRIL